MGSANLMKAVATYRRTFPPGRTRQRFGGLVSPRRRAAEAAGFSSEATTMIELDLPHHFTA
jgi:hypothetical protein